MGTAPRASPRSRGSSISPSPTSSSWPPSSAAAASWSSTRGVHGGYRLTREPATISVLDVVRIVEGEVAPVECLAHDYVQGSCIREGECASQPLWQRLKRSIDAVLSSTTLAELVAHHALAESFAPLPTLTVGAAAQAMQGPGRRSQRHQEVAHA